MTKIVYADVLFVINLFVNYFLLLTVRSVFNIHRSRKRLIFGAAVGALGSFFIYLPSVHIVFSFFYKVMLSFLVVFCAFYKIKTNLFIKALICFFVSGFLYAGFMLALQSFISPENIVVKNLSVYIDVSPLLIALATVAAYFIAEFFGKINVSRVSKKLFFKIDISFGGKEGKLSAKLDTGNTLTEPFSGLPVALVNLNSVEKLLPQEFLNFLNQKNNTDLLQKQESFRVIPYSGVSGSGIYFALRPKKFIVSVNGKTIENKECFIAISEKQIGEGEFQMLLNPNILDNNLPKGELTGDIWLDSK